MSDIGLVLTSQGVDLEVLKGDLKPDRGLETAVIISLFSDMRIDAEELPHGESSKRGWWGDLISEIPGDKIGSRLWLLRREKVTLETANRAEEYALEALQWLIDDGVAETIEVDAEFNAVQELILTVTINQPQGNRVFRFADKWAAEVNRQRG